MKKLLKRLFRHLFTTRHTARQAFPASTLKAIQDKIAEGERAHRAEARMIVESSLSLEAVLTHVTSRQRAQELFAHYRVWDTEENIGVLLYVNLADHQVEIITDRAVGRAISAAEWQAVCHTMTREFANGTFHDSTLAALDKLNGLLTEHFPDKDGKRNELTDRPLML
ncbi:TPM domain-containing protein [Glaciimonas immobilis]|uniref:Putative membrane protein n=1 Tax=Glaciimonas immobilis TaxID=728004 RepID=A0A840RPQ8_9BURK|nr:TPM domain-containing protein [Glaciimonas immobilis]KAF3999883.1 TPM domain-containing protein [Glaciimonas immobilis]MBB5200367.1 putative membrane protein [Glaciimonas immobilis]